MFDDGGISEIGRGHLRGAGDRSFTIYRYDPAPPSQQWLRVFWIPVWEVPGGEVREQRILTYPVCLLSISAEYARLVGPRMTAARVPLTGSGWTFGVMLRPGAGRTLLGRDVSALTNRHLDLAEIPLLAGVVSGIRTLMREQPGLPAAHAAARALLEERFSLLGPVDSGAALINRVVARVEEDPGITTVAALCGAFGLKERTLQRLCSRYLGLTPRWLIRQRRLQDAGQALRSGAGSLSAIAAGLGYADQAHFSRNFRRATGWTPGEFAELANPLGNGGRG
ncbi:AraC family transcriptional regulator [Arthrobacter sp. ATA002]|uniref:helix-turn-helix domain-containing protein n=1 Tax=Arthrobacter sp. ATA002 TaxID=2991715 RepID=UPI0022A6EFA3|nr:AraC family transcriptional regulator [Arthrobacter sp. ATA002]WAP51392.1 AraC family transcriptional regulator [Arthrobacter sp. ATA002]